MRLAVLFAVCLLAVSVVAAVPADAADNPLTGKPAAGSTARSGDTKNPQTGKPALAGKTGGAETVETNWFGDVARWIFAMQRRANRAIAEHMVKIHNGTSLRPLLIGMLLALLYGAIHTLGPGHGKVVVVTYFLAREAKISKGLWMGVQIAVTHVIAAIVAVFAVDFALRQFFGGAPAQLKVVRMISYGLIAVIGLAMLVQAIRRALGYADAHGHHHHGHGHDHGHGAPAKAGGRQMTLLSLSVGLVPCTGALLVMLYAIANDIMVAGYLIVGAISAGMAGMLAVLAVISIVFRRAVEAGIARRSDTPSRWAGGIDILGGFAITCVGLLLLAGVIWQPGA